MLVFLCVVLMVSPQIHAELGPNFVLILTDDQDLTMKSIGTMKKTIDLIANQGITFNNAFVNTPICCPSRSTLLTGKFAHNLPVYNNSLAGGCSSPHFQETHERESIGAVLKREKKYKTFYAGKYLNEYGNVKNGGLSHVPLGFDWWIGLQGNSKYYNYTLSINGTEVKVGDEYFTDKIRDYAIDFLNQGGITRENFFLMLAPPACHAPFTPAPRHRNLFPDLKALRELPFNYTPVDKHWLVSMPPVVLPSDVSILDEIYRNRLRTLQSVDELVEKIVIKLKELGVLSRTYVIFMSDHGYHLGQFSQPWDKRQPYESDIRVPFLIRGPDIKNKVVSQFPISAVDVAPTILDLAGIQINSDSDGESFKNELFDLNEGKSIEKFILVEYWGEGKDNSVDPKCPWKRNGELSQCSIDSWCKCQDSRNNTYSCVLHLSDDIKFKFCQFEDDFMEVYNLNEDPLELNNIFKEINEERINFYVGMVKKLSTCKGTNCQIKKTKITRFKTFFK